MASSSEDSEEINDMNSLKNNFQDGMKLYEKADTGYEATNSPAMQLCVKQAINKFETATRQVSLLGLFSKNESINELSTESLQYLLLPALLGSLSLKLCDQPRRSIIDLAEIYFRDFLQRCQDYGVTNIDIPPPSTDENQESGPSRPQTEQQKLTSMVMGREAKIKRFREQKELKEKLEKLKKAMDSEIIDDQQKREYFTTLLMNYINLALDELISIEQEKPLLEYMAQHAGEEKPIVKKSKALKPIIITRDAVQKAVFGLGYPSLPTMTIEEFYDKRVRDGTFPSPATNVAHSSKQSSEEIDEEDESVRREMLRELDNIEELQRQRAMDEFKDDHRRGEGNRYNRS